MSLALLARAGTAHSARSAPGVFSANFGKSFDQSVTWKKNSKRENELLKRGIAQRDQVLAPSRRAANAARPKRPKGWSLERRARQAALIRNWRPWKHSTGPKTAAGKARCCDNALKHGLADRAQRDRRRAVRHECKMARQVLLLAAHNLRTYKALPVCGPIELKLRQQEKAFQPALGFPAPAPRSLLTRAACRFPFREPGLRPVHAG
jgi:hypothetical protein